MVIRMAEKMIHLAAKAGAGAVKFQTYKTELFVSPQDTKRYRQLKKFELTHKEFEKLSHIARSEGLLFISTPFDLESAEFLHPIVDAYKIASGDNTFIPLIQKVAATGKPVIISTGFANLKEG